MEYEEMRPETGCEMAERLREVSKKIQEGKIGGRLEYSEEIDSTNTQAKRLAASKDVLHGTVILANRQIAGKGRRGRSWESPLDSGIFMSILFRPQIEPEKLSMLTLVAALAAAKAVREETNCACQIKWPNDLVMNGKKICGILTEMGTEGKTVQYAVVGIGINVTQQSFGEELEQKATSIYLETGKVIKRSNLIQKIWMFMEEYYRIWEQCGDLGALKQEYVEQLVNLGRVVKVLDPAGEYTGTACGITDTGELLVKTEEGAIREVLSGEVSVRGVYGYV